MNSNIIFIVGLMGSGKTSVGKILAKKVGRNFYDTDQEIIKNEKLDISQIFNKYGEDYFRELEHTILKKIISNQGAIVSTGGGIVLKKENVDIMKDNGIIIFLNIDVETQIARIKNKKNRPLLKNRNLKGDLKNMKNDRDKIYESISNLKIDVSGVTKYKVIDDIQIYLNEKDII
ncbi:MAG: shikimate kinase [Pseudomonadota bacterium]|nr:shikimate kinase [Pseudomonadota bacterium]